MRPLAVGASGLGEVSRGLLLPLVVAGLMFGSACGAPDVVRRAQPAGGSGGQFSSSSSREGTAGVAGSTASTPPEGGSSHPGSAGSSGGPGGTSVAGGGGGAAGGASTTGGKGGTGGASATGGKGGTSAGGKGGAGGASATGGKGGGGGAGGSSYTGASGITTSPFGGSGGASGPPDTSAGGTGDTGGVGGVVDTTPATPLPTDALAAYVNKIAGKTGEIDLDLRVDNMTLQSVDMSSVTLRYWYQDDGLGTALELAVYHQAIGYSSQGKVLTGKAVAASPSVAGADHYLEFSFSGTLSAKGDKLTNDQFNIQVALRTGNYLGAVEVTNDYSYNGGKTGYDTKIAFYQNGKLIAGLEPGKG